MRRSRPWLGLLATALLGGSACQRSSVDVSANDLVVRRGTFENRVLMTGELVARQADDLTVPRSPSWQVQLRWLIDDGSAVEAGAPILHLERILFDSTDRPFELRVRHCTQAAGYYKSQIG